jgi:hypothetical protein
MINKRYCPKGKLCVHADKWTKNIEFYDINGRLIKIPYDLSKKFSEELEQKVNGEEIIKINLENDSIFEIPKGKVKDTLKYLEIAGSYNPGHPMVYHVEF